MNIVQKSRISLNQARITYYEPIVLCVGNLTLNYNATMTQIEFLKKLRQNAQAAKV
jgi:hypothetical protein